MVVAKKFLLSGNVQGVGFRFTTNQIAKRHNVVGSVKNLPDGRVEILVKASSRVIDEFIEDILQSRLCDYITESQQCSIDETEINQQSGFSIAY